LEIRIDIKDGVRRVFAHGIDEPQCVPRAPVSHDEDVHFRDDEIGGDEAGSFLKLPLVTREYRVMTRLSLTNGSEPRGCV
jgi:hypothetical protein